MFQDINGDGLPDRINHKNAQTGEAGFWVALNEFNRNEIIAFEDSLGQRLEVTYGALTDGGVHTAEAAQEPQISLRSAMRIVTATRKANGQGGFNTTSYRHGGAKADREGRGFLGFAWDEATDESTGVTTRTEYRQDYPFVGMPSSVTTKVSDGTVLSSSVSTYADFVSTYTETRPDSSTWDYQTHFPYLSEKTEQSFELDGSLVSTATTRQSGYDAYGNVGQVEVITSAGGETYSKLTTKKK